MTSYLIGEAICSRWTGRPETVFIDGILRKRDGVLLGVDKKALVRGVTEAVESLRKRVNVSFAWRGRRATATVRTQCGFSHIDLAPSPSREFGVP